MKRFNNNGEDGFSLLELVIAVGVIIVLTASIMIGYGGYKNNARQGMVETAAQQTAKGALAYESGGTGSAEDAVEAYNKSAKPNTVVVSLDRRENGCMRFVATYTGHDNEAVKSLNCGTSTDIGTGDGSDNDNSGNPDGGFDEDGYDRDGFDRNGFDRDGYDKDGFNDSGFGRDGFDRNGFDKDGFDRNGFDEDGFDRDGLDKDGNPKGSGSDGGSDNSDFIDTGLKAKAGTGAGVSKAGDNADGVKGMEISFDLDYPNETDDVKFTIQSKACIIGGVAYQEFVPYYGSCKLDSYLSEGNEDIKVFVEVDGVVFKKHFKNVSRPELDDKGILSYRLGYISINPDNSTRFEEYLEYDGVTYE